VPKDAQLHAELSAPTQTPPPPRRRSPCHSSCRSGQCRHRHSSGCPDPPRNARQRPSRHGPAPSRISRCSPARSHHALCTPVTGSWRTSCSSSVRGREVPRIVLHPRLADPAWETTPLPWPSVDSPPSRPHTRPGSRLLTGLAAPMRIRQSPPKPHPARASFWENGVASSFPENSATRASRSSPSVTALVHRLTAAESGASGPTRSATTSR
jgi:hypothetical protein